MENPYQTPESRIDVVRSIEPELAGRGTRFGAAMIDGLIMMAIILPLEYSTGFLAAIFENARTHQSMPLGTIVMWSLIGLVVFVLVQGFPLVSSGQTWGKKACSIKIVTLEGRKPSVGSLATRYAVYLLPGRVPYVGSLFSLVNICFIFRDDRRCIHDLSAGTRVIVA